MLTDQRIPSLLAPQGMRTDEKRKTQLIAFPSQLTRQIEILKAAAAG